MCLCCRRQCVHIFVAGKIGEATGGHDGEMTKEATLGIYNQIGWVAIGVGVTLASLLFMARMSEAAGG